MSRRKKVTSSSVLQRDVGLSLSSTRLRRAYAISVSWPASRSARSSIASLEICWRVQGRARLAKNRQRSLALGRAGRAQSVQQDQRALALPKVTVDLLAVAAFLRGKIEDVVLDLEAEPSAVANKRS